MFRRILSKALSGEVRNVKMDAFSYKSLSPTDEYSWQRGEDIVYVQTNQDS